MFAARNYCGNSEGIPPFNWRLIGPTYWPAFENSMNSTIATATVSDSASTIPAASGAPQISGCVSFLDSGNNFNVYIIPLWSSGAALSGYIYNPLTNSFSVDTVSGAIYNMYINGGVLLKSGNIYFIPYSGGTAIIYRPRSSTPEFINGTPNYLMGGVLMSNGNVYCYPDGGLSTTATIFNTTTKTYSNAGGIINFSIKNAILLKDGRIFLSGNSICRIYDPVSDTIVVPNISSGGEALLLPDGRVFIFNGSSIKIYYPDFDIMTASSVTPISGLYGSILLPNGKIFLVPTSNTSAQIYDASLDTLTTSSVVFPSGSNKYSVYTSLPNGKILLASQMLTNISRVYGGNTGFNQNVLLSSYYNASPK